MEGLSLRMYTTTTTTTTTSATTTATSATSATTTTTTTPTPTPATATATATTTTTTPTTRTSNLGAARMTSSECNSRGCRGLLTSQHLRSDMLVQGLPRAFQWLFRLQHLRFQGLGALTLAKCRVGLERGCDLRAVLQTLRLKISTSNAPSNGIHAQTLTRVHNFPRPKIANLIERKQIVAFLERG